MPLETATRILLPAWLAAFVLLDFVWPLARLRRVTGSWGVPLLRSSDPRHRLLSLALLGILAALVVGVARFSLGGAEAIGATTAPPPLAALGLALLLVGPIVVALAQRQMGASLRVGIPSERTALVQAGLFRVVRNPIFLGLLVSLAGVALAAPSVWFLAIFLGAAAAIAYAVRLEEKHLLAQHGTAYLAYASRVGRFLPGVGRLRAIEPVGGSPRV